MNPLFWTACFPVIGSHTRHFHIADVGDGLCSYLSDSTGGMIVDCGGNRADAALEVLRDSWWPSVANQLLLTHLHRDHYVGLQEASLRGERLLNVNQIVVPRIPEFLQSQEFRTALYALAARYSRATVGVRVYDAARWLAAVNRREFSRRQVSKGNIIRLGNRQLRVLWPPAELSNEEILVSVREALEIYEEAVATDEELAREHERISEDPSGVIEADEYDQMEAPIGEKLRRREAIPRETREADKALRKIANRLSLSFHEGSDLLIWGDQEAHEIYEVATELQNDGLTTFNVMLTPHHGTHWSKRIEDLQAVFAITSAGKQRIQDYRKNDIKARVHRTTFLEGDIRLPIGW